MVAPDDYADAMIVAADVAAARHRLDGVVKTTPVIASNLLSDVFGSALVLKAESLQTTGSFKLRGAMNKVAALGADAAGGVTTGSAGNHAQAVAFAAQHFGIPCEIFVPEGAPIAKIQGAQRYGATVIEQGASLSEAVAASTERAATSPLVFCHPYDDRDVIAGQGTLGLELVEQVADLAQVIIPLGGGGLTAGVATAIKAARPSISIVAVQALACAPWLGAQAPVGPVVTLADGIAVKSPGQLTTPIVERFVDDIVGVDEDTIADAMVMLMDRAKLYVEGAGAVGVAAVLSGLIAPPTTGTSAVVLSGGNVDLGVVPGLVRRHETTSNRRLSVFARIDDRPGGLARFLGLFADGGANLIEVEHIREGVALHVRETGVRATFEVRGAAHAERLIESAADHGYHVTPEAM